MERYSVETFAETYCVKIGNQWLGIGVSSSQREEQVRELIRLANLGYAVENCDSQEFAERLKLAGDRVKATIADAAKLGPVQPLFLAYLECSNELQEHARKLFAVIGDPNADENDRTLAAMTLADVLFPESL